MKKFFHSQSLSTITSPRFFFIGMILATGALLAMPLFANAVAILGIGNACNDNPDALTSCSSGYCNIPSTASKDAYGWKWGVCAQNPSVPTLLANGVGCHYHDECTSNYCGPLGVCSASGTCADPIGTSCDLGSNCVTGYCDPDANSCAVDPHGANQCTSAGSPTTNPTIPGGSPTPPVVPGGSPTPPAVNGGSTNPATLTNPLGVGTLEEFLIAILGFVKTIGGIFVVLMLVWTGFKFVTAQGNPENLKEARQSLFWTVLGALVLLGATVIAEGIKATVSAL